MVSLVILKLFQRKEGSMPKEQRISNTVQLLAALRYSSCIDHPEVNQNSERKNLI